MKQLKVTIGQFTDKGKKNLNQDSINAHHPDGWLLDIKGVALAVADGISPSPVSHQASEIAVKNFISDYFSTPESWAVKTAGMRVCHALNSWLYSQTMAGAGRYNKEKGHLCTLSAVVIKNHTAHIFHIGDSRIYRINAQGSELLTKDHRVWTSRQHSYLSHALGMEPQAEFEYFSTPVAVGDVLVLMTDGVYEHIPLDSLTDKLQHAERNLNQLAKRLCERALSAGSNDNLSIQIARIEQLPEQVQWHLQQDIETLPLLNSIRVGQQVDQYQLLREIHKSSRSQVYLAQDKQTKQYLVLKFPSQQSAHDPEFLKKLLTEEWVARRINSQHVVKTPVQRSRKSALYVVTEYAGEQTLAQWAIDNPQPNLNQIRTLLQQLSKGIYAFHRKDMLHQDLRPENILIDEHNTLKIADFGSVYIHGLSELNTDYRATYLEGTALYSAPEYFLGEMGSPAADLFSLAVITYFLLSGQYPYENKVARCKTLSEQKKLRYIPLSNYREDIPQWFDKALARALHPQPEKRYDSLFEFVQDLSRPNSDYLKVEKLPLIQREPIRVWQGISVFFMLLSAWLAWLLHQAASIV